MSERAMVGNVEVIALVDAMPPPRELAQFYPDVPAIAWAPYRALLDPQGRISVQFGFFALRSGGKTLVVDTGLGPGPHERLGALRGQALANLEKAGIRAADVDGVVITHLHGDHVGWNLTWETESKPRLTFPKARYYIPQGDWDHFNKPEVLESSPHMQHSVLPLKTLGALELVKDGFAVTPEVTVLATPGHTPGHQSILINSQGQHGLVVGDLFHSPAQVSEPDWNVGADLDKEMARRSRRTVMDRLEREGFTVAAGHMPLGSNIGRLVRLEGKRIWRAL